MLKQLLLVCTPFAGTQERGPVTRNIQKAFGTKPFFPLPFTMFHLREDSEHTQSLRMPTCTKSRKKNFTRLLKYFLMCVVYTVKIGLFPLQMHSCTL